MSLLKTAGDGEVPRDVFTESKSTQWQEHVRLLRNAEKNPLPDLAIKEAKHTG